MRRVFILMITSVAAGGASAEPANERIRGLEECFALTRTADAICDNPANDAATRLDCFQKSRNAQQECLEHVRAGTANIPLPPTVESNPAIQTPQRPPGKTTAHGKPADEPSEANRTTDRVPARDLPQDARGPPKPSAPLIDAQPREPRNSAPTSGWIVSQTVSPVDYSPLLVAELRSLAPGKPDAPSALVLRCRATRTEISVRTQGAWYPTRAGDVEIVLSNDGHPAQRFRWRLAPDNRSAFSTEDAADTVQGLPDATLSVAVNDATGDTGSTTFELTGIQAVREKLAAACHWPSAGAQSRPR